MAHVDIMIVGSQKSGTTSLLAYLGAHPGILPQRRREMTWFTDPALASRPFPESFYFGPNTGAAAGLRLGKLAGLMYDDDAVARLATGNPGVSAVAVVREPVARAYASFWFARRRGRETRATFEEAVEPALARIDASNGAWAGAALQRGERASSGCTYLDWSCYAPYLDRLQVALGPESVHVVVFEELMHDPQAGVAALLERFELDVDGLRTGIPDENRAGAARSGVLARARRRGGRMAARRVVPAAAREALRRHYRRLNETELEPPPVDPVIERRLRAVFESPNRRLEELLGREIPAWRPSD